MLTSVLEKTGKSQDFWAGKFDLDRSHLNKLLRGKRAVGPKAAGRLIAQLPQEYHKDLISAHLFDELLAVAANMGEAGKLIRKAKPSAGKNAADSAEQSAFAKFLGPEPLSHERTKELINPVIALALQPFLKDLAERGKG